MSSSRDPLMFSGESDLSRPQNSDASPGALRKISSGQRSSPVVSSEQTRTSSSRNVSNLKNFESTLRGIESLQVNNDERVQFNKESPEVDALKSKTPLR